MYRLNADQQAIVDRARDIAEGTIGPNAERVDAEGAFPRESIDALGKAGFLGLTIPTELGGMGQGMRVACAVLDEVGAGTGLGMRGNASAPMTLSDVKLGEDRALSEPGKGFDMMLSILPVFQLGNAAVSVGIAEAAVGATQRHLTTARIEYLDTT